MLHAIAELRRDLERQIDAVTSSVGELGGKVDKLTNKADDEGPKPFWWDDLDPDERDKQWAALEQWVDTILIAGHPQQARALRSCWTEHPYARHHVTAAWFAWLAAYRHPGRRGQDPAVWYRDTLPALQRHLTLEFGDPDLGACPQHPDHGRSRP